MKRNYTQILVVLIVFLISSCKKELLISQSPVILDNSDKLEQTRKVFSEEFASALILNQDKISYKWLPNWQSAIYKNVSDTLNYIYIPLELEIDDQVSKRKMTNVYSPSTKKFIIGTFSGKAVNYKIATYISNSTITTAQLQVNFLNNFSGYVVYKDLTQRINTNKQYSNSSLIEMPRNPKSINSQTLNSDCRDFYTCFYVSYDDYPGCAPRYVVLGGYDQCAEPDPSSLGCYYFFHRITQDVVIVCHESPSPGGGTPPIPGDGGGGGAPGSGTGSGEDLPFSDTQLENAKFLTNYGGVTPINPANYIDCFTDGKVAQNYKMTLFVDQPIVGQNDQFLLLGPMISPGVTGLPILIGTGYYDVGHVFVMYEKNNTDGTSVKQVFGFYPGGAGFLPNKGIIKDDSSHPYNISYTKQVNGDRFFQSLDSLESDYQNAQYVLFRGYNTANYLENNCADAALNWFGAAGVYDLSLPGSGAGAFATTPGNLGYAMLNSGLNVNSTPKTNAPTGHGPCN